MARDTEYLIEHRQETRHHVELGEEQLYKLVAITLNQRIEQLAF